MLSGSGSQQAGQESNPKQPCRIEFEIFMGGSVGFGDHSLNVCQALVGFRVFTFRLVQVASASHPSSPKGFKLSPVCFSPDSILPLFLLFISDESAVTKTYLLPSKNLSVGPDLVDFAGSSR